MLRPLTLLTINHDILLKKLAHYGIRGTALSWFDTYLKNRHQYTEIGDILSDIDDIHCGVPQGSILGPLLFLIYINDIVQSSNLLKFYLFADDTTIFYSTKVNINTEKILNIELEKVTNWLNCNKLSLNIGKSSFLKFSNIQSAPITIKMANYPLEQKNVVKYLGVLIDDRLSWKYHINNINLKIRKGIGMINKVKSFISNKTCKTLYYSFVYPYLDYNILNWSSASHSSLNPLRHTHKKAIRSISLNKNETFDNCLKNLSLLPLDSMTKLRRGIFMWKLNSDYLPKPSCSWFNINSTPVYNRRPLKKFSLPLPRTEFAKRHHTFTSVKLWNSEIPNDIKASTSLNSFKTKFKKFLVSNL